MIGHTTFLFSNGNYDAEWLWFLPVLRIQFTAGPRGHGLSRSHDTGIWMLSPGRSGLYTTSKVHRSSERIMVKML